MSGVGILNKLFSVSNIRLVVSVVGLFLLSFFGTASLLGQGHMVGTTVPLEITTSGFGLSGTFKATFHGDDGDTLVSKTTSSGTVEGSDFVYMKTGVEYDLTLWKSSFASSSKVRLSAPPGWLLYVASPGSSDLIARQSYLLNVSNVNTDLIVKVLPSGAASSSLEAGLSTSLSHEGIIWSVGLGSLSNGDSAGVIQLRAAEMAEITFEPGDLFYSAPSPEVDYYAPNGVVRQVFSPQALADIVDTGNNKYTISFYDWTQVEAKSGNLYPTTGTPYVVYEISESGDEEIEIKKTIGSKNWRTRLVYSSNNWTLYDWTEGGNVTQSLRKVTTAITYSGSTWKYAVVTEKGRNSSGIYIDSSKTRYTYKNFDWGYEITKVENGYGESYVYDTDYKYFEDEENDPGEYSRLSRITRSDGGSTYFYYYTDFAKRGLMRTKYEPFQDDNFGRRTVLTYELDVTGHSYVLDEVNSFLRNSPSSGLSSSFEPSGRTTYDYTPRTINGFAARETTVRQYSDAVNFLETKTVHYREDISGNGSTGNNTGFFRRGQPYSIKRPDGTQTSFAYVYSPSYGVYTREAIEGLTSNPPGSDDFYLTTYSSSEDIENIYVTNKQNVKRHWNIKGGGLVYGVYDSVADGNGFELMKEQALTYNSTSRLHLLQERVWTSNTSPEATWNTLYEASYSNLRLDWTEDATGVHIDYLAYDTMGRVEEVIEVGGDATIADIHRMYTYDGSNRTIEQYKMDAGGTPESIPSTWIYDLAGRLKTKTLDCCKTVDYAYNAALGTVNTVNSDGGYVLDTYYRDGSLDHRTGDAATPLYVRSKVVVGQLERWKALSNFTLSTSTNADSWSVSRTDWLGRSDEIEQATFDGGTRIEEFDYNSKGQITARHTKSNSSYLIAPYRYEYDVFGRVELHGLDVGNNGILEENSSDRITKNEYSLSEDSSGHWWSVSEVYAYPSSSAVLISKTESRMVAKSGTLGETVVSDQFGNKSTTRTALDRSKDKVTSTTSFSPSLSNDEVTVYQNGLLISASDTAGNVFSRTYDDLRRLKTKSARDDVEERYDYVSGSNRVWKVYEVIPSGGGNRNTLIYEYDTHGRVEELVRRNKHQYSTGVEEERTIYGYNTRGQVSTISNNADFPVNHYYDDYGRLEKTEQLRGSGNESEVQFFYEPKTGLLQYKKHFKTSSTSDDESYAYNDLGALSKVTHPNAKFVEYSYSIDSSSAAGDMTGVSYSDSTPNVVYSLHDRLGRATQIADATGTRIFSYLANNGLSLSKENLDNGFYGSGNDINRLYESDEDYEIEGRYRGMAYAGKDWTIEYNSTTGRIDSIKGEVESYGKREFTYGYDDYHVTTVTHGSYEHSRVHSNWREDLEAVRTKWGTSTESNFSSGVYSWGHQLDEVTLVFNGSHSLANKYGKNSNITYNYTYDTRSQLTQFDSNRVAGIEASYVYDDAGNRTSSNDSNGLKNYSVNNLNQLTGSSLAYDTAGNQVDDASWDYLYDAANRLTRMWGKTGDKKVLKFKYDYMGRRVEKSVWNSETTYLLNLSPDTHLRFTYDGMTLVAEMEVDSSDNETLLRSFYWGMDKSDTIGGLGGAMGLLMIQDWSNNTSYFPSYDLNGNLVALHDESGNWAAWYEYDPFGNVMQSGGSYAVSNPIGFSSQYTDRETGQVYYGFRYYDPKLGRFGNRDPIGEEGGLNLYRFVDNNPVNVIDVHGLNGLSTELDEFYLGDYSPNFDDDDPGYRAYLEDQLQKANDEWDALLNAYALEDLFDTPLELVEDYLDDDAGDSAGPGPVDGKDKDDEEEKSDCEKYVDDLVAVGSANISNFSRNTGLARWSIGIGMVSAAFDLASENLDDQISGFRPELVAGDQKGEVYRHVMGTAGSVINDSLLANLYMNQQINSDIEQYQGALSSYQNSLGQYNRLADSGMVGGAELLGLHKGLMSSYNVLEGRMAELYGDQAGIDVGNAMRNAIDGNLSGAELKSSLMKSLCE